MSSVFERRPPGQALPAMPPRPPPTDRQSKSVRTHAGIHAFDIRLQLRDIRSHLRHSQSSKPFPAEPQAVSQPIDSTSVCASFHLLRGYKNFMSGVLSTNSGWRVQQ
ncbi:MAG: hypothetical protein P8Z73_14255, partial [Desulfobacteraceae bacterium]